MWKGKHEAKKRHKNTTANRSFRSSDVASTDKKVAFTRVKLISAKKRTKTCYNLQLLTYKRRESFFFCHLGHKVWKEAGGCKAAGFLWMQAKVTAQQHTSVERGTATFYCPQFGEPSASLFSRIPPINPTPPENKIHILNKRLTDLGTSST